MFTKKYEIIISLLLIASSQVIASDAKISLTLVLDDSLSMMNDISDIRCGTRFFLDAVLNSTDSQIEDLVLVTFNDPATALRTVTKDKEIFMRVLNNISLHGNVLNNDCPENTLAGIIKGLENSRPQSMVFVVTDASPKDFNRVEEVKKLASEKAAMLVFVLTGNCNSDRLNSDPDIESQVFQTLADATSGRVFKLNTEQDYAQFMNYAIDTVRIKTPKL